MPAPRHPPLDVQEEPSCPPPLSPRAPLPLHSEPTWLIHLRSPFKADTLQARKNGEIFKLVYILCIPQVKIEAWCIREITAGTDLSIHIRYTHQDNRKYLRYIYKHI